MSIGLAGAFLGGMLALLSPCSVMLLPSFFAYAFSSRTQLFARTLIFFLGLITALVPVGIFAGSLGALVMDHRALIVGIAAILIILFGVAQLSGMRLRLPSLRQREGTGVLSVYILGIAFGVAGTCSGPVLGAILTVAALGGNAAYGGLLLAVYAAGMAVPMFILALLWDGLDLGRSRWLRPRPVVIGRWKTTVLELVSGVLMIGIGVLMLLTEGTAGLGGMLTITQQFAAEQWASRAGSRVGDLAFLALAVLVIGLVIAWRIVIRRGRAEARDAAN